MDRTTAKDAMKELTMALMYLSRFSEGRFSDADTFRAWKGYDFDIIDQLDAENCIWQGDHPSRAKSVCLTEAGIEYGKSLLEKYGIDDWK